LVTLNKMNKPTTAQANASQCPQDIDLWRWPKLQTLRAKLGQKAKQEKQFRFYSLYDHVCRTDTLAAAWAMVQRNDGAPGVDGVTIDQIAASEESESAFLADIQRSLRERTYRPAMVRRVYILKQNGKLRPLGIPTVRDRVVQCAVKLIIEPIFEQDFEDSSYGFRPGRSAHQALDAIRANLLAGRTAVYDADLANYFDTIPHDKLLLGVRTRVVDKGVLGLIKMWLRAPVVEPPPKPPEPNRKEKPKGKGGPPKITRPKTGTPQGGVLSPLLANLHLHWFDRAFAGPNGPGTTARASLIRYADDFVIMARYLTPSITRWIEDSIEGSLGLKINQEKTRVIEDLRKPHERLDFLGYSYRYDRDLCGRDKRYLNVFPCPGAVTRERAKLTEMTNAKQCMTPAKDLIERVNRHLSGWKNYFKKGYPSQAYRAINNHVHYRLGKHLRRRSQRGCAKASEQSMYEHLQKLGLKTL
jgi:RNA-directed DNA polymerase